jgi:hypothetical protein
MSQNCRMIAVGWATLLFLAAGCAAAPSDGGGNGHSDPSQDRSYLRVSRKLWDCDVIESLRYLKKGVQLGDPECFREYLARSEAPSVNVSQRVYMRLFIEGLLRKGPILAYDGTDVRGELCYQLCWAWRYTQPCCLPKATQILEVMIQSGVGQDQFRSAFMSQLLRETGLRADVMPTRAGGRQEIPLYAAEESEAARRWLRVPAAGEPRDAQDWMVAEANAWGGGTDRLYLATNVLAFLVNDQGEPCFRGRRLWLCNLGTATIYYSSPVVGASNRELLPGQEELLPVAGLETGKSVTGIPLSVRYRRTIR